ncbi:CAP domain-containing protein [Radiobacillus deserti]
MNRFLKSIVAVFAVVLTFFIATSPVAASSQNVKVVSYENHQSFGMDQLYGWLKNLDWDKYVNWNNEEQEETPQKGTNGEQPNEEEASNESTTVEEDQGTKEQSASFKVNAFEQEVVKLTNKERQKKGLQPLKLSEELSKVARTKSQDMVNKNYFSHQSPTYGSPFDMMKQFGISYRTAGENIAKGQRTPASVVQAWMNSEGHRANILNKNFTQIGVGFVETKGTTYWTQMFIGK